MPEETGGNQSSGSIVKITFESYSDKQKIMKAAPKLRDLGSDILMHQTYLSRLI